MLQSETIAVLESGEASIAAAVQQDPYYLDRVIMRIRNVTVESELMHHEMDFRLAYNGSRFETLLTEAVVDLRSRRQQ